MSTSGPSSPSAVPINKLTSQHCIADTGKANKPIQAPVVEETDLQQESLSDINAKMASVSLSTNATPKMSSLAPTFIPKFITLIPTTRIVPISDKVKDILTTLNRHGYYAVIVGGAVRDPLLGKMPADEDIVTNCPAANINTLLGDSFYVEHHSQGHRFHSKDNIDLSCSTLSLENELAQRCLYENTLIADRDGLVYDKFGAIERLLYSPTTQVLDILATPNERFKADPGLMLRLIRFSSQLQKLISDSNLVPLITNAHLITTLPFGKYLKHLEKLFLGGFAYINMLKFAHFEIACHLLPGGEKKKITCNLVPYTHFLYHTFIALDSLESHAIQAQATPYHVLGLLLLPEIISLTKQRYSLEESITKVTQFFCDNYTGPFNNDEKACFTNQAARTLQLYFELYLAQVAAYRKKKQQLAQQAPAQNGVLTQYKLPNTQQKGSEPKSTYDNSRKKTTLGDFISL